MVDSYPNFFHIAEHMLSAYPKMGIHGFIQSFPELQNKWGSSNGHNTLGHSMQTDYHRRIQLF
jgi:hypothetical protein